VVMRRARRRRPAGNARSRKSAPAIRPSPHRTAAAIHSYGGLAPHKASRRRACARSSEFPPAFDTVFSGRIDDGDQAHNAAVATVPVPWEIGKSATFAGDLVDVAADILDTQDAVLEQDAVHRLPLREIVFPVSSTRPLAVFLGEV